MIVIKKKYSNYICVIKSSFTTNIGSSHFYKNTLKILKVPNNVSKINKYINIELI